MTRWSLIFRSLCWHWRTHAGVVAGAAVATAMLVGSLIVGDSVRASLRDLALQRLGSVRSAMNTGDRLFREGLADDMTGRLGERVAPVLLLGGAAATPDGGARASNVQIVGVDRRFWELGNTSIVLGDDGCAINQRLAARLGVGVDDVIVVRMTQPSALPRDAPLATVDDSIAAVRLTVRQIVTAERFGHFNLRADHVVPMNLYLPLALLQERLEAPGAANVLLTAHADGAAVDRALADSWQLADVSFEVRRVGESALFELTSDRVFLDAPPALQGSRYLTYLVNALASDTNTTPYSMVTATDDQQLIGDLADDQIIITQWLADDLGVEPGESITLRYYVMGPMRELIERDAAFRVSRIVPIDGAYADPTLMPAFPGLVEAEHCRAWDPGFAIDTTKIRDKDEAYWDAHRGTPKAYITLEAGRRLWGNRFGDTTAVRFDTGRSAGRVTVHDAEAFLRDRLDVTQLGLRFEPVRRQAIAASQQGPAAYFGYMFIGFSFFIILAAVLLMTMLFVFSVEQRTPQIGTLKAIGFTPGSTGRLLIGEGFILAGAGVAAGVPLAIGYTAVMLHGLATWWADAINGASIAYHATPTSIAAGAAASLLVCLGSMALSLRTRLKAPARTLLGGDIAVDTAVVARTRMPAIVAALALAGSIALAALSVGAGASAQAGLFFGAGFLMLLACGGSLAAALRWWAMHHRAAELSFGQLAARNTTRRRGRSMAVAVLMATGVFLVVAVGANRKSADGSIDNPNGPAGGFQLIAESTLPIYHGLTRDEAGEPDGDLAGASAVAFRVAAGDDASCLNLNRAATPRLIGVQPDALNNRFTIGQAIDDPTWRLLDASTGDDRTIPAIADKPTAMWGLGLAIGDTLSYADERGRPFKVKLVGLLESSVLQGNLIIHADAFTRLYPSTSGYRLFLIDTDSPTAVSQHLTRRYADRGMTVTLSQQRIAAFMSVENTYLSIFQSLGAMGLLIGTVGLGVVVLRNMLERRRELALLRAVGYTRRRIGRLVVIEHAMLLIAGIAAGVASATVAVWPAVASGGGQVPIGSLISWLTVIAIVGVASVVLATAATVRGPLLDALRSE
jgi:putative ABC transport system permease protein